VHHRVGEVDEERPFAVRSNELYGLLRVAAGDRVLVGGALDLRLVVKDGDVVVLRIGLPPRVRLRLRTSVRRSGHLVHVVGVGDPPVRREPVPGREMLRQVTEVPLAEGPGHVAGLRERLGYGDLLRGEPAAGVGKQDPPGVRGHPAPDRVAAREQRGPAGRAHAGGHVELGPLLAFGGHPVQVGRPKLGMAERPEVSVAQVVGEDDHEVGLRGVRSLRGASPGQESRREPDRHTADVLSHGISPLCT